MATGVSDDDFVLVNPESKEDHSEAQKEYNPKQSEQIEEKHCVKDKKYEMHPFSKKIMSGQDDKLLCMIRRDKAPNPVVYRARYKKEDDIQSGFANNPIETFWLKIAGGSIKMNRLNGKMDDRVELSYIETNLAYGVKYQHIKEQEYKIQFNALPKWSCTLKICPREGKPKLFGRIGNEECYLKDIHVKMTSNWYVTIIYIIQCCI